MRYLLLITAFLCLASMSNVFAQHDVDESNHHDAMEEDNYGWPPPEGMIIHTELVVSDLEQAVEFYSSLFNWEFFESDVEYMLFMTPGEVYGGITTMGESGIGGTAIYIYTADIEAKLEEIEEAGGEVFLGLEEIPDTGWFALFTDPDGNLLGLFNM